jgi:hypothetical protein
VNTLIALLLVLLVASHPVAAQTADTAQLWRSFAEKIEIGSTLKVRLRGGQTFKATLVQAGADALMVQPKTRTPVPVQPVAYDAIVSLERERPGSGVGAGKAAAIGVATGVGAFFLTMVLFIAAIDD